MLPQIQKLLNDTNKDIGKLSIAGRLLVRLLILAVIVLAINDDKNQRELHDDLQIEIVQKDNKIDSLERKMDSFINAVLNKSETARERSEATSKFRDSMNTVYQIIIERLKKKK